MKLINVLVAGLVFSLLSSCHEEDLTSRPLEMALRYEFPEGDNEWDKDLEEIAEEYKTYLIYKNLKEDDFDRSWVDAGSSSGVKGSPLNDEQAAFYTNFMKNHIFTFLPPEVTDRVLPIYILMAYHMYTDTPWGASPNQAKYDGMDFWAFCLEGDVPGMFYPQIIRPKTPWDFKVKRGTILKEIMRRIVEKGNIAITVEFENDFDYETQVEWIAGTENNENHYKKRGFPGQMSGTNGYVTIGALRNIASTSPKENLINYMHLAIRYDRDSVLVMYPRETYPKIIRYYDFTVNYLKNNYKWDIAQVAILPKFE